MEPVLRPGALGRTRPFPFAVLALVLGLSGSAPAQTDWLASVFPDRSHDFGTVARGSKLRHSFPVVNNTNQVVRIQSWQTKCGCTEVRVGAKEIPPGAQTFVEATLDTTKFDREKSSGLTLVLDRPTPIPVELGLRCFIESSLTVTPGLVDFGTVARSGTPSVAVTVSYSGGRPGWKIDEMKTISPTVSAQLEEVGRNSVGGPQYRLTARLDPKELKEGRFKDEITLVTNDPAMPRIPISVAGRVQSTVSASPSTLDLGTLKPGQTAERTILVRSSSPFQIQEAKVTQGECTVPPIPAESKALHVLKVTFKAPAEPGSSHTIVELVTSVPNEPPVKVTAFTNVVQ